jgi:hypothetical protein
VKGLFLVLALWSGGDRQAEPSGPELSRLREQERAARLELEAARSKKFYLVADVSAALVSLKLGGVDLASYRLRSVDVGLPMSRPGAGDPGSELADLYSCQSSHTEELPVIEPGAPPPAEPAKPEQEAEKRGPARVTLSCDPSLAVHFASSAASSVRDNLLLPGDPKVDRRVRIVLDDSDAERLFASLPGESLLFFTRVPQENR